MIPKQFYEENSEETLKKLKERFIKIQGDVRCTCEDCPDKYECCWAYDPYNTCGDCIMDK